MDRSLIVDVRDSTWPGAQKLPAFPASFHKGAATHDINIPATLLMIGYLTTPTSSTGVSLSEFWAWVRYLAAVTADNDFRITRSFADLDAHQKTILSDDFGMGVPLLWLNQKLSFDRIIDGYYFMQKFSSSVGATQRRTAKRGPNKTPDFIARDVTGVWHVIECKGTQSGIDYSGRQLGHPGPPPTGGVAQKQSVIFPSNHTGQRLACGLSIGIENGGASRLTIIDPEPDQPLRLGADQLYLADDAATRGVVSKMLRLTGFEISAEATASPLGLSPATTRYSTRRAEEARQKIVQDRDTLAREELRSSATMKLFDQDYRGRERQIELPRPIIVHDRPITRVVIRQGISDDVVSELQESPTNAEPTFGTRFDWTNEIGQTTVKGDEFTASMQMGDIFRFDLILE